MEVTGEFTYGETDPPWNSKVDLDLNLADIDPFFGEDIELEGDVDATLAVEGAVFCLSRNTLCGSTNLLRYHSKEGYPQDSVDSRTH